MPVSIVRLAGLLVLVGLAGATPALALAQDAEVPPAPGQGRIIYERLDDPGTGQDYGNKLELYRFTFDPEANLPESQPFVPEQREPPTISHEAMMVFVDVGPFVLYTPPTMENGAVVVVSGDGEVRYEEWLTREATPGPMQFCPSPCAIPADRYAVLDTNDYVFQRANSGCVY